MITNFSPYLISLYIFSSTLAVSGTSFSAIRLKSCDTNLPSLKNCNSLIFRNELNKKSISFCKLDYCLTFDLENEDVEKLKNKQAFVLRKKNLSVVCYFLQDQSFNCTGMVNKKGFFIKVF